eukprot:gene4670-14998_t
MWKDNVKSGMGKMVYPNGVTFVGKFIEGKAESQNDAMPSLPTGTMPPQIPLYIKDILNEDCATEDLTKVHDMVSRYFGQLRKVFAYFCSSPSNPFPVAI